MLYTRSRTSIQQVSLKGAKVEMTPTYLIFPLAFLATLLYFLVMIIAITRMETDYFVRKEILSTKSKKHSILRLLVKMIKNSIGITLIIVGVLMLVLPGQGLLTILMGLFFLDFPGKRKMERFLIQKPPIHKTINWVRKLANKKPLIIK